MKQQLRNPVPATPRKLTADEQTFIELFYALEQSRRDLHTALTDCLGFLNRASGPAANLASVY